MCGISAKAERKQNGGKQFGAVDRGIDEADPGLVNLTLIHCQFCPNLALLHHTPPRSYVGFRRFRGEKVKKVRDINLTSAGWGALCVRDSLPG